MNLAATLAWNFCAHLCVAGGTVVVATGFNGIASDLPLMVPDVR